MLAELDEIYEEGRKQLQNKKLLEWCDGGADTHSCPTANITALRSIYLKMRVLEEAIEVDISTSILGTKTAVPFGPAPVGFVSKVDANAEEQIVKAASDCGCPVFLSIHLEKTLENLVRMTTSPVFWALPPKENIDEMKTLFERGKKAGVKGLGVVVDVAHGLKSGSKYIGLEGVCPPKEKGYFEKLREYTDLPLFIKGIVTPEEAKLAADIGYDGIVVSNHGGRVLDYVTPTIKVLPSIVKADNARVDVLIDGGFRTSIDIFKGLALGANAVLLGRATIYGIAAGGEEALKNVYSYLSKDLKRVMSMTATRNLSEISSDKLVFCQ